MEVCSQNEMKVLSSSALQSARLHTCRDWDVIESKLISSVKPHGIGLCPILTTSRSPSKGRRSLSVREGYSIPKDYPLAVLPLGCAITSHSWLDRDRTYLMPSDEDLGTCLKSCGHSELSEVVGIALYLSFHLSLSTIPPTFQWFTEMMLSLESSQNQHDKQLLDETARDIHSALAASVPVPHLDCFAATLRYAVGSAVDLESSAKGDTAEANDDAPEVRAALIPVLDAVANKYQLPANVALRQMDRDGVRSVRRDGYPLFGCGQGLNSALLKSEYLALVSIDEIQGGQELSLNQVFPDGDPSTWSPLQRLRLGVV